MEVREQGATALVHLLGHKGDLMFVHFRPDFEALTECETAIAGLRLFDYLVPTTSYVSIVELGMYEMTAKIHKDLAERGLKRGQRRVRAGVRRGDGPPARPGEQPALPARCRPAATSASTR